MQKSKIPKPAFSATGIMTDNAHIVNMIKEPEKIPKTIVLLYSLNILLTVIIAIHEPTPGVNNIVNKSCTKSLLFFKVNNNFNVISARKQTTTNTSIATNDAKSDFTIIFTFEFLYVLTARVRRRALTLN